MLTLIYKGLSSSFRGLNNSQLSTCGLFRPFSSCCPLAARRIPTDEELSTMTHQLRWYYKKMADPAFREQESATRRPKSSEYHAQMLALPESPERARYLAAKRASCRRSHEKNRESLSISKWIYRLSYDQRGAFDWKTHRPVVYSERVHKTCSTCLSSYMHGSKLW